MTDIYVDTRGLIGPQAGSDGARLTLRQVKNGSLAQVNAGGYYQEAASRGNLFVASTAVAGVAPGTALSTAPPLVLWNPTASGKLAVIHKLTVGYVSGTLGAGTIVLAQVPAGIQPAAPTGGAELVPTATLLNGSRGVMRAFQGSTVAATPTILRGSIVMGAGLASTAMLPAIIAQDLIDGEFIVPAGAGFCVQGVAAAGTSPLVAFGIVYEEITA